MTQRAAEQATPEPQPTATPKRKGVAFKVIQAPKYQHVIESWEAVAREEESGVKHVVREDSDGQAWDALHKLLLSKGCTGAAVEDAEAGSEYNEKFFPEEE